MDQKIIKVEDITDEDVNEFKEYLDKFISVVQNSIESVGKDRNGNEIKNFVVGGTTEGAVLPSGVPLYKKYAAARNRLYRFPYINNGNWTNLYFDWKPEHFDEPTLFVTVPGKKIKGTNYKKRRSV